MNMFIRSHARFKIEAEKAKAILRAARVVASDETGRSHRRDELVSLGFPLQGRGRASTRLFPRRPRRERCDGGPRAASLDLGSLFGSAKSWRAASDVSGASGPRRRLRVRARLGRSAVPLQALVDKGVRPRPDHRRFRRLDAGEKKAGTGKAAPDPSSRSDWIAISPETCKPKSGAQETSSLPSATTPAKSTSPTTPPSASSARV